MLDTRGLDKIVRKHIRGLKGGGEGEGGEAGTTGDSLKQAERNKKDLVAPTWGSGAPTKKADAAARTKKKNQKEDDDEGEVPLSKRKKLVPGGAASSSSNSVTLDLPGVSFSKPGVTIESSRGSQAGRSVVGGPAGGSVVGSVRSMKGGQPPARCETYFNFTAIMEGTQKGQAKAGAQRHLSSLITAKVPDTNAINRLETELKCYDKCAVLVPDKILSTPVTTIQKNIKDVRQDLGIECPLVVHSSAACSGFGPATLPRPIMSTRRPSTAC
jgi:hypothetical protein